MLQCPYRLRAFFRSHGVDTLLYQKIAARRMNFCEPGQIDANACYAENGAPSAAKAAAAWRLNG
jgi:hypothetical protein